MEHVFSSQDVINLLWFCGWVVAVAVLFLLALKLPLQTRQARLGSLLYLAVVIGLSIAVTVLANLALSLHNVHFDLTRERLYTPAQQALDVVDRLQRPVKLTYFYQGEDHSGKRTRDIVEVMGLRNPLLEVYSVDPDKQPTLARNAGVKFYNAAVLEADGRRIIVRSTDETEIAIGIQRVLRERVINLCFIEGHNEYPIDQFEFHTHLEGLAGHNHDEAASAIVKTSGHGIGRLRRALEALGYGVRSLALLNTGTVPADCALVVAAGPRNTYLPAESAALETYLQQGGSLLLMLDLGFVIEPGMERLLQSVGLRFHQNVVVDPKSHYATDPEMVAVTAYSPHPITKNISFTFYPGIRSLELLPTASEIKPVALMSSSSDSYSKQVAAVQQRQVSAAASDPPAEAPQPHILAAAVEGRLPSGSQQPFRLVAIGDGDFASNSFLPYMANSDLMLATVRWLVREERSTSIAARIPVPSLILLTNQQMQRIFLILVVLLPLAVLVLGGLIWWRRR